MGRHKTKKNNTKKKIYVFALFLLFFGGLVTLFILNPHPGYKKLNQQLSLLEGDKWTEISRENYKDNIIGSCGLISDPVECPYIIAKYKYSSISDSGLVDEISRTLKNLKYKNIKVSSKCERELKPGELLQSNDCSISADNAKIEALFIISNRGIGNNLMIEVGLNEID